MHINGWCAFFVTLVGILLNIQSSDGCDTGRIFIGSINETYPDQIDRNGIYHLETEADMFGYPVYKHEKNQYYLYHIGGNIVSSMWAIGETPGSLTATLIVGTSAESVEDAQESWQIWNPSQKQWITEKHLKTACVDASFITCQSGHIRLSGLSPWNSHQEKRTGDYHLTNDTHELRPVYKSADGQDYLFYMDGLWMVGPAVGRISAALFVLDYAWSPEYIIETWIVFNGRQFLRDSRLKVTCAGAEILPTDTNQDNERPDPLGVEDIMSIAEGMLGHNDQDPVLPVCGDSHCENGGTCIRNELNEFLCACPEPFFGLKCQINIECGAPPELANAELTPRTGHTRPMAFYTCVGDTYLQGPAAVTCQPNGEWSEPPVCMDWLNYVSPPIQPMGSTRRGLMNMMRGRRQHHRHSRHTRSAGLSIDDLKAFF